MAERTEQSSTTDCSDRCWLLCLLATVCTNRRGSSCLPGPPLTQPRRQLEMMEPAVGLMEWPSTRATRSQLSVGTGQRGAGRAALLWCRAAELPGNCPAWFHSPLGTRGLCTALQALSEVLRAMLGLFFNKKNNLLCSLPALTLLSHSSLLK